MAIASRLTTSATAAASARSDFRNLSRAGTPANKSRTSTIVPRFIACGATPDLRDRSTSTRNPVIACAVREATLQRLKVLEDAAAGKPPIAALT